MARVESTKLLVSSSLDKLRPLMRLLKKLPWPTPLQRLTQRGLERLAARIPELAQLLDGKPRKPATQRASKSALPELLAELSARDYQTRASAAQALAGHGEPEAIAALVAALRDRSVEVAVASATALGVGGSPEAERALRDVIANVEGYYHPLTRAAAVHGLGALLTSESERAPLYAALRDHDAEVSIAAIAALSASHSAESALRLLDVIENQDGFFLPITRLAAARALERLPAVAGERLRRLGQHELDLNVSAQLSHLLARELV